MTAVWPLRTLIVVWASVVSMIGEVIVLPSALVTRTSLDPVTASAAMVMEAVISELAAAAEAALDALDDLKTDQERQLAEQQAQRQRLIDRAEVSIRRGNEVKRALEAAHDSRAEALRQAQLSLREQGFQTWCPFILLGDPGH